MIAKRITLTRKGTRDENQRTVYVAPCRRGRMEREEEIVSNDSLGTDAEISGGKILSD